MTAKVGPEEEELPCAAPSPAFNFPDLPRVPEREVDAALVTEPAAPPLTSLRRAQVATLSRP